MNTETGINISLPSSIFFTTDPNEALLRLIEQLTPDKVIFLADENTKKSCLPHLRHTDLGSLIEIKSGEIYKNIDTCQHVWTAMTEAGLTRKSLLVNVGGGVIGDLGGFCAATFKRGIRFVNFPTTLLAMVDANIGGKLGIDFQGFKNHIGVFQDPDAVVIFADFLKTLPERELRSGFAEVLKHGLIQDRNYWKATSLLDFSKANWGEIVRRSAEIKFDVVTKDPKESGLRKILNFGHTLGHAIETTYLNQDKSLLHGEAIAAGMILEGFISTEKGYLSEVEYAELETNVVRIFGTVSIPHLDDLMPLMLQDKKNTGKVPSFSLIGPIGESHFDQQVSRAEMEAAVAHYQQIK